MNRVALLAAIAVPVLVAGCVSLGGNVKGNFVCRAPDGMCAPTSKIDDQALAVLNAPATGDKPSAPGTAAQPTHHSATALKVLLPARTDRFGRWRDAAVVYVEPEQALPQAAAAGSMSRAPGSASASATVRLSLMELAAGAPELAAFDQVLTSDGGKSTAVSPVAAIRRQVEQTLGASAAPPGATPMTPPAGGAAPAAAAPLRAPSFPATSGEGGN